MKTIKAIIIYGDADLFTRISFLERMKLLLFNKCKSGNIEIIIGEGGYEIEY